MIRKTCLALGAVSIAVSGLALSGCTSTTPGTASNDTETRSTTPAASARSADAKSPAGDGDESSCRAEDVATELESDGDVGPSGTYSATITLQNTSGEPCSLDGTSEVRLVPAAGGDGLEIEQVEAGDGQPPQPVTVVPEDYAYLTVEFPTSPPADSAECLEGKWSFMRVTLPGDDQVLDAIPRGEADLYSPVCGPVAVTAWYAGPE